LIQVLDGERIWVSPSGGEDRQESAEEDEVWAVKTPNLVHGDGADGSEIKGFTYRLVNM
jgi:hypothetical protein